MQIARILLVFLCFAPSGHAQRIFCREANQSLNGGNLPAFDSDTFFGRTSATDFTLVDDDTQTITHVRWWGSYADISREACASPTPADQFLLEVYTDTGHPTHGTPDVLVASYVISEPNRELTDLTFPAFPALGGPEFLEYSYETELDPPLVLDPGIKFWLVIRNDLANDCGWIWETGPGGGGAVKLGSAWQGNKPWGLSFCLESRPDLIALEAVQVVQNWNNSIPLYENKRTLVRAYVEGSGVDPQQLRVRLRGSRLGVDLPPLLSPDVMVSRGFFTDADDPTYAMRRRDPAATFNFDLPSGWMSGTVDMVLETEDGLPLSCPTCPSSLTFLPPNPPLRMRLIDVRNTSVTAGGAVETGVMQTLGIIPHGGLVISRKRTPPAPADSALLLVRMLWERYVAEGDLSNRVDLAILPPNSGGGVSKLRVAVAETFRTDSGPGNFCDPVYGDFTPAHEVSHALGLLHLPQYANSGANGSANCLPYPWTDFVSNVGWPYPEASLGPRSPRSAEVWGYDFRCSEGAQQSTFYDPRLHFELMSYCVGLQSAPDNKWVSDYTYGFLANALQFPALPPSGSRQSSLVVIGEILTDNSIALLSVHSANVLGSPTALGSGFSARTLDSNENILSSMDFGVANAGPDAASDVFFLVLPDDTGVATVEIVDTANGVPVAQRARSSGVPSVQVLSPNGGEVFGNSDVMVTWSSMDPDTGDSLSYNVDFSKDAGITWENLVFEWTGTSFLVAADSLAGTDEGLVRVTGNDGFNSGSDVSDTSFTVANRIPEVYLISPAESDRVKPGHRIQLRAYAYDPEDGPLPGNSIEWFSNIDGPLGTGDVVDLPATSLTRGMRHIITATALDSAGESGTDYSQLFAELWDRAATGGLQDR